MITITKDDKELVVTKGVYENLYKSLGYEIVGNKKPIANFVKEAKIEDTEKNFKDAKLDDKKVK